MRRLFSILMLLVCVPCFAASTTQPAIHVRDVTAQADTSEMASGDTLYLSTLPAKWTLDFDFGLAPGNTAQAEFSVDAGKSTACYQPPYLPANRAALSLGVGKHTIALTVNGKPISPVAFTIANAPPVAVPTVQVSGQMGSNAAAVNDPMLDLSKHPQYVPFIKASHLAAIRVWTEGGWTTHHPASYYALMPAWHQAGVNVILVANFQNSSPRCSCPSDADWTGWLSAIPPPAVTGAWAIEVGNEVNTKTCFTGTSQQLTHLMQIGYPIVHAKGYVLIAPSTLNSTDEMKSLASQGAYQWCDYVNTHSYRGTAAQVCADGCAIGNSVARLQHP